MRKDQAYKIAQQIAEVIQVSLCSKRHGIEHPQSFDFQAISLDGKRHLKVNINKNDGTASTQYVDHPLANI